MNYVDNAAKHQGVHYAQGKSNFLVVIVDGVTIEATR